MRIGMQTWGSDGDIRPILALGGALVERGHTVSVAVVSVDRKDYAPLCAALGVRYVPVSPPQRLAVSEVAAECGNDPSSLKLGRVLLHDFFFPALAPMADAARSLADASDVLVGHFMAWPMHAAALQRRKPFASVAYWPGAIPDARRAPPGLPGLGRTVNRLLWAACSRAIDWVIGPRLARLWDEHGLPRRHAIPDTAYSQELNLVAASRALYPGMGDWAQHRMCGPFHMPPGAEPSLPRDLEDFLDAGDAPAFLGMGSSGQIDGDASEAFLVKVALALDRRCIVQLAPGRAVPQVLGASSRRVHFVHQVAHAPLFPRCAAVLHHGGAGTTHSVLAAGKPAVVVSFMAEQAAWGKQLVKVGAGGGVFGYRRASPERVARALRTTMSSSTMQATAARLAEEMRTEDGVGTAAAHIEALPASEHRGRVVAQQHDAAAGARRE